MKFAFLKSFTGRLIFIVALCILFFLIAKNVQGLFFPALFTIALYGGIVFIFLGDMIWEKEKEE
jgi:hypothetical protein